MIVSSIIYLSAFFLGTGIVASLKLNVILEPDVAMSITSIMLTFLAWGFPFVYVAEWRLYKGNKKKPYG